MKKILIIIIIYYQKYISPLKPATCRFYPTCSNYAMQAIEQFGCWKGSFLALKRILRCHPYNIGGYDPVPKDEKPSKLSII